MENVKMLRTIITLPRELKMWLDNYSKGKKQSTAETIREALREYKANKNKEDQNNILERTHGMWKPQKLDGLRYVNKLREEWE